jgi:hypothetical protein
MTFLYGAETWVKKKRDLTRIQAAEMNYLRLLNVVQNYKRQKRHKNNQIYFQSFIVLRKIDRIGEAKLKEWLTEISKGKLKVSTKGKKRSRKA